MEKRYKSLSLFEFNQKFKDREDGLKYLADRKWQNGFICKKCGNTKSCKG